jgi:hypothetical protein
MLVLAQKLLDPFSPITDANYKARHSMRLKILEQVLDQWLTVKRHQRLGQVLGKGTEPLTLTAAQQDRC